MYRIPSDLDLSKIVGQSTSQLRVGQFDMQFSFGHVHFAIQSDIDLIRNDEIIATWREGEWPSPEFYQIMNIDVTKYEIPNDRQIIIYLENQIEIHLHDNVDQYECMQISIDGVAGQWII